MGDFSPGFKDAQGSFIWRVLLEFGIYAAPPSAKNCLKAGLQQGFRSTRSQMKEPCKDADNSVFMD